MEQVVGERDKILQHGGTGGEEAKVPQHWDGGSPHGYLDRGSVINSEIHGP